MSDGDDIGCDPNPNDVTIGLGDGVGIVLPCPEAAKMIAESKWTLAQREKVDRKQYPPFPFEEAPCPNKT